MEPVVTLMHFVWPQHVEDRGGLRAPEFPAWFGEYAARVRDALGDRVRYWITINEPNALLFGYLKPFWLDQYAWPPGLPAGSDDAESMRATAEVIRNLFLANRSARLALASGPGGERRLVSANSYYLGLPNRLFYLPIPLMKLVDRRARSEKGWSEEDWVMREGRIVLHPRLAADAPPPASPMAATDPAPRPAASRAATNAPRSSPPSSRSSAPTGGSSACTATCPSSSARRECVGQLDYVAFDYYFGTPLLHNVGHLMDVIERRYHTAPIWSGGLYDALLYFQGMFPKLPVFVIENGVPGVSTSVAPRPLLPRPRPRGPASPRQGRQRDRLPGLEPDHQPRVGPAARPGRRLRPLPHRHAGDPDLTRRPTPASVTYRAIVQRRRA